MARLVSKEGKTYLEKKNLKNVFRLTKSVRKLNPVAGPQREIFPGGTKIDAGPPKFGEVQTNQKRSSLKFDPIFCPKLGEEQKKRSSLKFGPIFCSKNWTRQPQFFRAWVRCTPWTPSRRPCPVVPELLAPLPLIMAGVYTQDLLCIVLLKSEDLAQYK